ncbi:MAG: DsbA family protein [Bradymonadia bacterium]|jgi:protein-disulfide isomerase
MANNKGLWISSIIAAAGLSFYGGYAMNANEGLKMAPDTATSLAQLDLDSEVLPIAGSEARGSAHALVTAVAFVDYQSVASRAVMNDYLDKAMKDYGNAKLRVVYKAFPLAKHEGGVYAAKALYAAAEQGKFWELNDAILAAGADKDEKDYAFLSEAAIDGYAKELGLDLNKFKLDVAGDAVKARLNRDIDLGKSLQVGTVPTVYLNGKQVEFSAQGAQAGVFEKAVEDEMRRMSAVRNEKENINYVLGTLTNGLTKAALMQADSLGRPARGNQNALVTVVAYSDYECPFCARGETTLNEVAKKYPNDLRIVFAHNPLPFHQKAKLAHQATWAAQKQGKFWAMHDRIFENPRKISEVDLLALAKDLGLDMARFQNDWKSPEAVAAIDASIKEGSERGVSGTPTFLINGELLVGAQPIDKFSTLINKKLEEARILQRRTLLEGEALYQEILKSVPKPKVEEGPPARVSVALGNAPIYGKADAPVTIVEFTDFECPFCSRANSTLMELQKNNPDKVRIAFKHYPLSFHKNAKLAHQAVEAAKNQGKFWEYYGLLFDNQKAIDRDSLIGYATGLGLDVAKFTADMDSAETAALVDKDIAEGNSVQVRGTPHFFINGTRLSGAQPITAFQNVVDSEYAIAQRYIEKGVSADRLYDAILAGEVKDTAPKVPEARVAPEAKDVAVPAVGKSPTRGDDAAPVTIFQFSEFQCPFCARVEPTIDELLAAYPGKIKLVFKQFPLAFHKEAPLAAQASLAAHEQGKFWEMHKELFANPRNLERADLERYAEKIGLNMEQFKAALDSEKFKAQVEAETEEGKAATISGTPSFIINGKLLVGAQPIDAFKAAVDAALAK